VKPSTMDTSENFNGISQEVLTIISIKLTFTKVGCALQKVRHKPEFDI
jgi:hypothetical protein